MSDLQDYSIATLCDNLEDAIEMLEECYDELKRHQSPKTAEQFLQRLNYFRGVLKNNDIREG